MLKFCQPCCIDPLTCLRANSCLRPQPESRVCDLASDWDLRGLSLAQCVAQWSKDPSTKVGAAIFRPDKTVASVGFNGFPRGIADDSRLEDRTVKYEIIVHAELNAIFNCQEKPSNYTLFSTLFPCVKCASAIIQSGIKRVCSPVPDNPRWIDSNLQANMLLHEARVETCLITPEGYIQKGLDDLAPQNSNNQNK